MAAVTGTRKNHRSTGYAKLAGVLRINWREFKAAAAMNITVLYVGSSLLGPLKDAEREIKRAHNLDLRVAAYNFGSPLSDVEWKEVEHDISEANIVFVVHVMDGENALRLTHALERHANNH